MQEKSDGPPALTEQNVVTKVSELLETLDHVKKYNALTKSLRKFALIVVGSMAVFLGVGASMGLLNLMATLDQPEILFVSILWLLVPILGIASGVLLIRRRVNSIKAGEWKDELSNGFPSALKILMEMDWDETFDEISSGRVSYAIYGLLKLVAYSIIAFFVLGFIGNFFSFLVFQRPVFGGPILGLISLVVVFFLLRKDLSKRYYEIRALDKLLWELRWFSFELRRAEF